MEEWKSERKKREEFLLDQRERFDHFMELEDLGMFASRALALAALREDLEKNRSAEWQAND